MSLDRKINRIQFLSGNSLKVIAVLTMLIDHLCKIVLQWLLSNYWGAMADNGQMSWERFREIDYFIRFDLQSIGTIAFPLFCFLLAEGFQHTRSKKRYIGLMLAFALISEVPFDIGFFSAYILPSAFINGNKMLVDKVFSNLIGNAIKYSPQRADIWISVLMKHEQIVFSVENAGVHIPENSIPRLFDAFYRVEQSRSRKTGGSGLGLYIVQEILHQYGSECTVCNTQAGVKFSFII